jgi:hypothetical protein
VTISSSSSRRPRPDRRKRDGRSCIGVSASCGTIWPNNTLRTVDIGRERLREILDEHKLTFQKTRTLKVTNDLLR